MNPKFNEMLAKKKDMKPSEKHAKMGVLKDLKHSLADSMSDKMGGMKKVSVMSDSPEGLDAGLDKAKMMAHSPMDPQNPGYAEGGMVNPNESDDAGMPMDESAESTQDPEEPEHVGYAEGGEVQTPLEEAAESADQERAETVGDMGANKHPEFHGLNIHEVNDKLQHLMQMKKQMEQQ